MSNGKSSHARPARHWLSAQRSPLRQLHQRTQQLRMLTERLQQDALPASLEGRWLLARLDQAELVLVADSPLWASQLRYLGRRLQDAAGRYTGTRPARVTVKIAEQRQAAPEERATMSAETGRNLRAAAEGCDDPRLRRALLRLARRADDRAPD